MTDEEFEWMRDYAVGLEMAYFSELSTSRESISVTPGSDLDACSGWITEHQEHLSPKHVAWRAIGSASEHAGCAEFTRFATKGGVVPRTNGSLARTALLGAAKAIYLLAPDDPYERRIRAARLANSEAADAQRMIQNWSAQDSPDGSLGDLILQSQNLAAEAAQILADAGINSGSKISETELLKVVVLALSDKPDDAEEQVLTLWNRLSGIAHARSWTWSIPSGLVPREDFVGTWFIPVTFLGEAWRLWNSRRGSSSTPHTAPSGWKPNPRRWRKKQWRTLERFVHTVLARLRLQ